MSCKNCKCSVCKPPEEKKTELLQIRVGPTALANLTRFATNRGMTVSASILHHMRGYTDPPKWTE